MTEPVVITDRFDAILFVDRTTRARPNRPAAAAPGAGRRRPRRSLTGRARRRAPPDSGPAAVHAYSPP
jgi:hypothetical protein